MPLVCNTRHLRASFLSKASTANSHFLTRIAWFIEDHDQTSLCAEKLCARPVSCRVLAGLGVGHGLNYLYPQRAQIDAAQREHVPSMAGLSSLAGETAT